MRKPGHCQRRFLRQHITTFKGAARRLEVVGKNDNATIFKDFAHSPSKLTATIDAVKAAIP
jgi:UDP-N-acetylmuramate: L-alanyl-gamma-D-glutamyl-meso-diaminopimelate ligase